MTSILRFRIFEEHLPHTNGWIKIGEASKLIDFDNSLGNIRATVSHFSRANEADDFELSPWRGDEWIRAVPQSRRVPSEYTVADSVSSQMAAQSPQDAPHRVERLVNPLEVLQNPTRAPSSLARVVLPPHSPAILRDRPLGGALQRPQEPVQPGSLYEVTLRPRTNSPSKRPRGGSSGSDWTGPQWTPQAGQEHDRGRNAHRTGPTQRRVRQRASTSTRQVMDVRRQYWLRNWVDYVLALGESSDAVRKYGGSDSSRTHFETLIANDATNSLAKHVPTASIWKEYAHACGFPLGAPEPVEVADFVFALSQGGLSRPRSSDGRQSRQRQVRTAVATVVKAIRWIARRAEASRLLDAFSDTLVQGYMKAGKKKQRREAPPLPLAVVVKLEERLLQSSDMAERIWIGFLLALVWAALRFLDGQRTSPFSLHADSTSVRGVCDETKTSENGQPFGIVAAGFTTTSGESGWAQEWSYTLRSWAELMVHRGIDANDLDFCLPDILPRDFHSPEELLARPMPYCVALSKFRSTLQESWMGDARMNAQQARQYSLHIKSTTLSWASQLDIPEPHREAQGHHRSHGGRKSVRIYSRDDVYPALLCQEEIIHRVRAGWRPMAAQQRGAAPPLPEPHIDIPERPFGRPCQQMVSVPLKDRAAVTEALQQVENNQALPCSEELAEELEAKSSENASEGEDTQAASDVERRSESGQDEDEASSVAEAQEQEIESAEAVDDEIEMENMEVLFFTNLLRGTVHAAIEDESTHLPVQMTANFGGRRFEMACGAQVPSKPDAYSVSSEPPPRYHLCSRSGCAKVFSGS